MVCMEDFELNLRIFEFTFRLPLSFGKRKSKENISCFLRDLRNFTLYSY